MQKNLENSQKLSISTAHLVHDMNPFQSAQANQIWCQASLEQSLGVFVRKFRKNPLPSLEKYLEKQKKFAIFTVHLEHDMNTWQSAWGNQILRQAFLEQSLGVFVGKFQKNPFPTLEKYFEKQSKICDFYRALGT